MADIPDHAHNSFYDDWDGAITRHRINSTTVVISRALPGSLTTDSVWSMYKVVDNGTDMAKTWADGNNNFDNKESEYTTKPFS